MEQSSIRYRNMHVSPDQEMQKILAEGYAGKALKQSRCQVIRDMEAMRENANMLTEQIGMKNLFKNLLEVVTRGSRNIKKHLNSESSYVMVQAAAQKVDTLFHQEIDKRFMEGSEYVGSSDAGSITKIITAAVHVQKDVAIEMGKTTSELVSDASVANWEFFQMWWNLHNQFDEARTNGLTMFETLLQKSQQTIPEITKEYRDDLENIIDEIIRDYAACYNGMGMKLFANSMLTICVVSAGTSLALAAGGVGLAFGVAAPYKDQIQRHLMKIGKISVYVAVAAGIICLLIAGYNYFVGKDSQPEENLKRWQRYISNN
ncbi:unnamed protein product [Meganyctiphanes norvegica]|uniref:Uncharacterized protein n=1 Tax=Meganyctiphanes norvegica TaxID=48144 RepID=A0AAV2R9M1_MEGNR